MATWKFFIQKRCLYIQKNSIFYAQLNNLLSRNAIYTIKLYLLGFIWVIKVAIIAGKNNLTPLRGLCIFLQIAGLISRMNHQRKNFIVFKCKTKCLTSSYENNLDRIEPLNMYDVFCLATYNLHFISTWRSL